MNDIAEKNEFMEFEYFPYKITQEMQNQLNCSKEKLQDSYLNDRLFYQRFTHIKKIICHAGLGIATYNGFNYLMRKEIIQNNNLLATSAALATFMYIYFNLEKSRTYLSHKYIDKKLNDERITELELRACKTIKNLDDEWRNKGDISRTEPEPWCLQKFNQNRNQNMDSNLKFEIISMFYNAYRFKNKITNKKNKLA